MRCFPPGVGFGLRISVFGLASLLLLSPGLGLAQPKNPAPPPVLLERAEGERQARELLGNLLAQKPAQSSSNIAVVKIRGSDRKETQIPARFAVLVTPTNYLNIYEAGRAGAGSGTMKLTIVHSDGRPNEYLLSDPAAKGETEAQPKRLTPSQLMIPFAGSDFWVADLGLEFLHWPQPRVLKREMRRSQFCAVLESINPHSVSGGYSRVVSWVGTSHPDEFVLVHADAYDSQGRLLKEFDPKSLEKVNGAYQLESMEMRNVQTNSRTVIEFDLGPG
jgi:hypothetical protein